MSSALLSFLPTAAIQERVPERVMPKAVTAASVVTARNKVRYTPISGQTQSSAGQNIITFRVTDAASWLDLATAGIHLRMALPNATPATTPLCLDDFIHSIFDRIRVSVNGVLVEDVTDVNVKATAEAYASATFDYQRSAHGEQAGAWKWNSELGGVQSLATGGVGAVGSAPLGTIAPNQLAIQSRAWQAANSFFNPAQNTGYADSQGHSFIVPLSFLTGLAKMGQYFPLRLVGNLEIVLFLATTGACEYNGGQAAISGGSAAAQADYTITDVTLEVDSLTLAPMVVAAQDKLAAADSSEGGVVLPVDVITTNRINYASGTGVKSLQVSRGTTQLLSLHVVKRNAADLTDVTKLSLSTFLPLGAVSQQTQIGAVFQPTMKDDSQARMWHSSAKAYGKFASQFSAGLVSRDRYEADAPAAGGIPTPTAGGANLINQHWYALSQEQEAQENIDLQGISTLASGSVIQVNIEDAPSAAASVTNPVANVFIRSRRYIQLANQSVQVIGN